MNNLLERASSFFTELQNEICSALEAVDEKSKFQEDIWDRSGGGGGKTRVIQEGKVFEKGGVNFSLVFGEMPEKLARQIDNSGNNTFSATGISLVIHPYSPMVPTVHANLRYIEKGKTAWFGGGMDLTPYYPYREDAQHFHSTIKKVCDKYNSEFYKRYKKWCDEYFFLPHRNETRGVGGIFFDYLKGEDIGLEQVFSFVCNVGKSFVSAYCPIVERRKNEKFSEQEKDYQLIRRGRYAEFNLLYDRGTVFGLETKGRTESILMSLPPVTKWVYNYEPELGSREAKALEFYKPQDWLDCESESKGNEY